MSEIPGERFEPRQTARTDSELSDYTPNSSHSLPLSAARQALLDDILSLYCCKPTVDRVTRYTSDAIYDDEFSYANDRHKIAGQWFALPTLFHSGESLGHEVIKNDKNLIQLKNKQQWTLRVLQKSITINHLISLSLDHQSGEGFIQVKYHKDQANERDYSHSGLGFNFRKWQADGVAKYFDSEELKAFEKDKTAPKETKPAMPAK